MAGNHHRTADADYAAKLDHETSRLARRSQGPGKPGVRPPSGDPGSGVLLVAEPPAEPQVVEALRRSLDAVGLCRAYVTWSSSGALGEELRALDPPVVVACGPLAARAIDDLGYPLAYRTFSEAPEGAWFSWTKGAAGLRLPALAPALDDEEAKVRFWKAFRVLRRLQPYGDPAS